MIREPVEDSLPATPLAEFCQHLAAPQPAPAGVAAAAVTAAFGASLVCKALEIRRLRPDLAGTARELASALLAAAAEDCAAVRAHLHEPRDLLAAPLQAAESAVRAFQLCREAAPSVTGLLAADLRAAAELLRGASQAILACVDANLERAPSASIAAQAAALRQRL